MISGSPDGARAYAAPMATPLRQARPQSVGAQHGIIRLGFATLSGAGSACGRRQCWRIGATKRPAARSLPNCASFTTAISADLRKAGVEAVRYQSAGASTGWSRPVLSRSSIAGWASMTSRGPTFATSRTSSLAPSTTWSSTRRPAGLRTRSSPAAASSGFGEDHVAVPWNSLRATPDLNAFVLNVDAQTMTNAPEDRYPTGSADTAVFQQQRQQADQYWQKHVPS